VDLNDDGKPDLAVTNVMSDDVRVLLNLGNGTFAASVSYAVGPFPGSPLAPDLNGDGKPDLVLAHGYGNVGVLFNLGNGTFAPEVNYILNYDVASIAAVDLNGDGKPDLAVANGVDVSVLLYTCLP
jgi:hypothetical protein